jgi:PKD repeat protein
MGKHRRLNLLVAGATAAIVLGAVATGASVATAAGPAATSSSSSASSHAQLRHPASIVPLRDAARPGPFDAVFNNMDYNGGPVMPSNTNYMVLWSPTGLGAYPATYVSGLQQWFTDLAHDSGGNQNTDSVSAQYQDLTGAFSRYATTFGGALIDRHPYPASQCPVNSPVTECLTDLQIQQELERFVASRHLKTDLSHEYFLLTPPHVESCFNNDPSQNFGFCSAGIVPFNQFAGFCAYHEQTTLSPMLIFAQDPFVAGNHHCDDGNHPNGLLSDGELNGGLSHEQNESVTDPIPNDAWTNGAGADQGFEVGDQCGRQMGTPLGLAPNGAKYNQVINGHLYWYQEEWSNVGHTCLQRLAPLAAVPTARFSVTAGSGLTLNFDATGSTAPGGVAQYVWQFNAVLNAQTVESTTPTISYTFPSAGAYSIGLTIFASDGSSTGTGAIVTTGQSGFSPGFTFAPTNPSGHRVRFSALTTVSAQPVLTYLWEFGDGSTGSGANPVHTYPKAGTYEVTSVMFSGVGSAFPGQGAAPIVTHTVTIK